LEGNRKIRKLFNKNTNINKLNSTNSEWDERKHDALHGTVIAIENHAGTKDLTIMLDAHEGIELSPGCGIGIPGQVDDDTISSVASSLLYENPDELEFIKSAIGATPPYPSINIASPSLELVQMLVSKVNASDSRYSDDIKVLNDCLYDSNKYEQLQACYDVSEILLKFPGHITLQELIDAQGPTHGNKTYCQFDSGTLIDGDNNKRQYLKISVLPEGSSHVQNLFQEQVRDKVHYGETSNYLCNLEVGDQLYINTPAKIKKEFGLPKDLSKGFMFVCQGNGAAPCLSLLKEIHRRHDLGETIGPINVVIAARDEDATWGLKYFKPYLESGLVSTLDLALSDIEGEGVQLTDTELSPVNDSSAYPYQVRVHQGDRLMSNEAFEVQTTGFFESGLNNRIKDLLKNKGDIYIASGKAFRLSIEKALTHIEDELKTQGSKAKLKLHISESKSRLRGIEEGWTRRLAGKPLINLYGSGSSRPKPPPPGV
jgi:hypothetical protein